MRIYCELLSCVFYSSLSLGDSPPRPLGRGTNVSHVDDPLLHALQGNGALAELQAAQKTVRDIVAVVAAV